MKAPVLHTIAELVQELQRSSGAEAYTEVLGRYRADLNDLAPYLRWNTRHYTRTCLHRGAEFELLVVCYGQGQQTSIHGHDGRTTWIRSLLGEVVEERFRILPGHSPQLVQETHLFPGGGDLVLTEAGVHRFINVGPGPAATMDLHAGPVRKWRVYNDRPLRTGHP